MPRFIMISAGKAAREVPITNVMTIGRDPENDLQILEEKASRKHCCLRPDGSTIFIEDLGSSNGTRVNGQKVTYYALKHLDTITIGKLAIIFYDDAKAGPSDSSPDKVPPRDPGVGAATAVLAKVEVEELEQEAAPAKNESALESSGINTKSVKKELRKSLIPHSNVKWSAQRNPGIGSKIIKFLAFILFVCTIILVVQNEKDWKLVEKLGIFPESAPIRLQPDVSPGSQQPETSRPTNSPIEPPIQQTIAAPPSPIQTLPIPNPAVVDLKVVLNRAIAERDRAMASGNFLGARAAISFFLKAHPASVVSQRAQDELHVTEKLIEGALQNELTSAQEAASEKKYRLAIQFCTRLLSSDPAGTFGARAREILTNLDKETQPRYAELHAKAMAEIAAGKLDQASETLRKALEELGGMQWAELALSTQFEVLMMRNFLKRFGEELAKTLAAGATVPIKLTHKNIEGLLSNVTGVNLEIKNGAATFTFSIKAIPPTDLMKVFETLHLSDQHLELACLWMLTDRKDAAFVEMERALAIPEQAAAAAAMLVGAQANLKNLHVYDFSKWQQQSDWEAVSGNWSTRDDQYVLENNEGGDTFLRYASVGGLFFLKNARMSFDFDLSQSRPGYFFAFEFGKDDKQTLGCIFSAGSLAIECNVPGFVSAPMPWTPGRTHVDLAILGNNLTISLNGQKPRSIPIEGLSTLSGTITFRVRETACAIDNIILRNVE